MSYQQTCLLVQGQTGPIEPIVPRMVSPPGPTFARHLGLQYCHPPIEFIQELPNSNQVGVSDLLDNSDVIATQDLRVTGWVGRAGSAAQDLRLCPSQEPQRARAAAAALPSTQLSCQPWTVWTVIWADIHPAMMLSLPCRTSTVGPGAHSGGTRTRKVEAAECFWSFQSDQQGSMC